MAGGGQYPVGHPGGNDAVAAAVVVRDSLRLANEGLISETFSRAVPASLSLMVGGAVYFASVPLIAGESVATLSIFIGAAGVGMTLSRVGLYDANGNLVASSADQGVSWNTAAMKSIALSATYLVPVSGVYYAAVIGLTATTMPQIARSASAGSNINVAIGTGRVPWGLMPGQTDLPAVLTVAIGAGTGLCCWVGAS